MPIRIGIVGSPEKDATGKDVSLAKFLTTGTVEVFCFAPEYIDFSLSQGIPVVIEKESHSWNGEIVGGRTEILNEAFTPGDFVRTVGKSPVGVYLVRLDRKTPATPEIVGAGAYLV